MMLQSSRVWTGSGRSVRRQQAVDAVWAVGDGLPHRWRAGLVDAWEEGGDVHALRRQVSAIKAAINATDDELRAHADAAAKLVGVHAAIGEKGGTLAAAHRVCGMHGIPVERLPYDDPLTYWRMGCSRWWLGQIRRAHALAMETGAVRLGLVHQYAGGDCYVSRESVRRHRQMTRRNRAMLEAHDVESEDQRLSLAGVVDRSIANRAIRRGELMTRLRGFEMIGDAMGHRAIFVTLTCPSRFHRYAGGRSRHWPNPNYEGATPTDGQRYLRDVWARIRAQLAREGVEVYGFRIAEPHHDGCPHWHFVLWAADRDRRKALALIMRDHGLRDSPDEPGARRVRVVCRNLWRGGACAYVAKYIAKHTDGFGVSEDLLGNPIAEATERVQVWASTWRIRQFQQIGGPPIGLWREVRRIDAETLSSESAFTEIVATANPEEGERVDFAAYIEVAGGVFCRRDARPFRVESRDRYKPTRYGDRAVRSVAGVAHMGGEVVETRRREWRIVRRVDARTDLGLVSITVRASGKGEHDGQIFSGCDQHAALFGAIRRGSDDSGGHRDEGAAVVHRSGLAGVRGFIDDGG